MTEFAVQSKEIKVAIIEDRREIRDGLAMLVGGTEGFSCSARFGSMEEALPRIKSDTADIVLCDIGLPGMSGPELQQELEQRGLAIPIVFITAQGDKSLHPRLVARGAAACLFKPFSDTALVEAVNGALAMR